MTLREKLRALNQRIWHSNSKAISQLQNSAHESSEAGIGEEKGKHNEMENLKI